MRRRWVLNDNWDWQRIALGWGALAWSPGMLVGNVIVGGIPSRPNVGLPLGFLAAELPLIALGLPRLVKWLAKIGPPVRRVREPVTTDLRRARDD